ncbi:hypothetical protein Tco_1028414 [Tanacetum coccineum]|uniref:Uncharacterized protein n=1 Tax=Tanacetum coccineum TaxID=301880 RepID=A0ABQ5G1Z4_9ASTR
MTNCEIKGVTTRGGKTTTHDVQTNNTNVHTEEPLVVNHDKPVESNEVLDKDQPQTTNEPVIQTSSEPRKRSRQCRREIREKVIESRVNSNFLEQSIFAMVCNFKCRQEGDVGVETSLMPTLGEM